MSKYNLIRNNTISDHSDQGYDIFVFLIVDNLILFLLVCICIQGRLFLRADIGVGTLVDNRDRVLLSLLRSEVQRTQ